MIRLVNSRGYPIGQGHHLAKLTDREVDLVIDLRENGMTIPDIARAMETPVETVKNIIYGRRRCQIPMTTSSRP